ncbi:MAG TPA: hypothetical protein VEO53_00810 [Candidatus Binatia bacterium]|nr:hypothetical protein [Candidatus Binatia bacterium]
MNSFVPASVGPPKAHGTQAEAKTGKPRAGHGPTRTDILTRCKSFRNVWKKHGP